MIINEVDYKIMCAILNKQKNTKKFFLNGSSVKEIQEQSKVSLNRIYTGLRSLVDAGYVTYALKKGRTNTYILTNEGVALILETGKDKELLY